MSCDRGTVQASARLLGSPLPCPQARPCQAYALRHPHAPDGCFDIEGREQRFRLFESPRVEERVDTAESRRDPFFPAGNFNDRPACTLRIVELDHEMHARADSGEGPNPSHDRRARLSATKVHGEVAMTKVIAKRRRECCVGAKHHEAEQPQLSCQDRHERRRS